METLKNDMQISEELGGVPVVDYTGDWKQLVLHYPSGPSGSSRFATWERGAKEMKYYTPEGRVIAKWPLPKGSTYVDFVYLALGKADGELHGLFTAKFSTRIYGAED